MGETWRFIKAEYRKMKGTYLPLIFVGVPVLGCVLFLLYYSFSTWSTESEIMAYAEAMGAALPLLISLLSALSVELEEKNHFQAFLGTAKKKKSALLGKYFALLSLTLVSFLLAVGLFGAGFTFILGKEGMTSGLCVKLIFALWLPSTALYAIHLFLNLTFQKSVSIAAGAGESLISALFLTGLGERLWTFVPASWSARWATYITGMELDKNYREVIKETLNLRGRAGICLLITFLLCAIILIWFRFYEGRQCHD